MIIVCGSCPKGTGGTVGQEKQPEKSLRNNLKWITLIVKQTSQKKKLHIYKHL